MYCYKCGNQIADNSNICPYCGTPQGGHASGTYTAKSQYNTLCIIGFVLSCISLFIDSYGMFSIIGTILSVIGLLNSKKRNEKGKVFAIFGIVIGGFRIIYNAVWIQNMYNYAFGMLDDVMDGII